MRATVDVDRTSVHRIAPTRCVPLGAASARSRAVDSRSIVDRESDTLIVIVMACNRTKLVALALPWAFFAAESDADAAVAYMRSEAAGSPWDTTDNEEAMDLVFGAGAWDDLRFESADTTVLFSDAYTFIYIDGSDGGAVDLQTFLTANQDALEAWVAAGGNLFLNCAPNVGGAQSWGFFGTTLNVVYPGDPSSPYNGAHPIWQGPFLPISTSISGGAFAHANVSGGNITPIIVDGAGLSALAELTAYGEGQVLFGGLTMPTFWTPSPEAANLRANMLWYLGQQDSDGDGITDPTDVCVDVADPAQADGDGDARGDACDACAMDAANDGDGDLVCADVDNCPEVLNFNQGDEDRDGVGDVCDTCPGDADDDADGDGVCGDVDVCPDVADPDQEDADGDGVGDACETAGSESGESGGPPDTGGPDESGGPEDSGPSESTTGLDTTAASITVSGDDTSGATAGNRGDEGGCGCTTRSSADDALWLAWVIVPALRRRRAQEGFRR
jgi:hypothetical protein